MVVTEADCLNELLDRETTGDEWEADERPEAEKQAEAERRAEAMRRETQAEIEYQAALDSADRWGDYQTARMDEAVYIPANRQAKGHRYADLDCVPDDFSKDYYC